jgi:hypothetical protein
LFSAFVTVVHSLKCLIPVKGQVHHIANAMLPKALFPENVFKDLIHGFIPRLFCWCLKVYSLADVLKPWFWKG